MNRIAAWALVVVMALNAAHSTTNNTTNNTNNMNPNRAPVHQQVQTALLSEIDYDKEDEPMKKSVYTVLLAAMCAASLTLTGCGGDGEGTTVTPTTTVSDAAETTTVPDAAETTTTTADEAAATTATAETTTTTQPAETTTAGGTRTTTAPATTTAGGTRTTKAPTTAATKATTTKKPTTNTDDPWVYPYNRAGIMNDCKAIVESCGVKWDASITRNNCDDVDAFDSYKIEWIDPYTNEYNVVRKDKATLQAELREWLQSAKEVNRYGKIVSAVNVLVEPHWEEKGELYFRIVYKEKSYDFGAQPTEVRADGTVIKLFPDDPWRYPYDTDVMIADCKAYIESKGLIWDDSLNVDRGTWAGNFDTGYYTLHPEYSVKQSTDGGASLFGCIDVEADDWETHKYFKCVFIPDEISPGDYDIYVVHGSTSSEWVPEEMLNPNFIELAKKAIN